MNLNRFSLQNKVAIITGAGRGIGRTLAIGLSEAGADVVIVSRTIDQVEQVASEIKKLGNKVLPLKVDVTNQKDLSFMVDQTIEKFGKIDVLVNNAGVTIKKPSLEISQEDWDYIMDTNLKGMFFCAQIVGRNMVSNKSGSVINISSVASQVAIKNSSIYCASKGGLMQITKALAIEWAEYNVRVNAIAPAYIDTPLLSWLKDKPEVLNSIENRTPMARLGKPDEILGSAIFLASDAASYITGETIYVDGGLLAYGI